MDGAEISSSIVLIVIFQGVSLSGCRGVLVDSGISILGSGELMPPVRGSL